MGNGLLVVDGRISKQFGPVNRPEAWKQQEERCPDFEKETGKFKLCKYVCLYVWKPGQKPQWPTGTLFDEWNETVGLPENYGNKPLLTTILFRG